MAVSCHTASACTAVGYYNTSAGSQIPLAEAWNGRTWSLETTAAPTAGRAFYAVSCTATKACIAVGQSSGGTGLPTPLIEVWNGTTWTVAATPSIKGDLDAVSCTSATACTAVGYQLSSAGSFHPLAEVWNGATWSLQTTASPTIQGGFQGVSCTTATACTAVGSSVNSAGTTVPLAQARNGTSWTNQTTVNPKGSGASLAAVSCTTTSACTAVGQYISSSGQGLTLAERWNGSAWTIETTPNPGGKSSDSSLTGLTCTGPRNCTAVGYSGQSTFATVAEVWNGRTWTIQSTPKPAGSVSYGMSAVSCTASATCTAVGSLRTSSGKNYSTALSE